MSINWDLVMKKNENGSASGANPNGKDLHWLIGRAFYAYHIWLDRRLKETGLGKHLKPGMGPVLFTLFKEDDLIIKELAERTRTLPSTMTRTLRKMKRNGLITITQNKKDRRSYRIKLTTLARSLEPDCHKLSGEVALVMRGRLKSVEIETTARTLASIGENLKTNGVA
jgi:DNA-binding MarR family transcriptional regulator